jgi:hypothetical protein
MNRYVLLVVLLLTVAACTNAGTPARTPYPLPSGALALSLPTQPPVATPISSGGIACQLIGPERVTFDWDRAAHKVSFPFIPWSDSKATAILWPRGFSAREYLGRAELVAPNGSVVARDGEQVPSVIGPDPEHICMVAGTEYQPA